MSRLFCICFFGTKIYPIFARMSKNEDRAGAHKAVRLYGGEEIPRYGDVLYRRTRHPQRALEQRMEY